MGTIPKDHADIYRQLHGAGQRVMVEKPAGAGKTTLLRQIMALLQASSTRAVDSSLFYGPAVNQVCLAFNREAAAELQSYRLPSGAVLPASTMHSLGLQALLRLGRQMNTNDSAHIAALQKAWNERLKEAGSTIVIPQARVRDAYYLAQAGMKVGIVPADSQFLANTVIEDSADGWAEAARIASRRPPDDVTVEDARVVMNLYLDGDVNLIGFSHQLWLPVAFGLKPAQPYDLVAVDEAQDLSPLMHAFVDNLLSDNTRLLVVGDRNQSIYGFLGAMPYSMEQFQKRFSLPLIRHNVTYRCSQAVAEYARLVVPDFYAREGAPEGEVNDVVTPVTLPTGFEPGDMVLCRNNGPLLVLALRALGAGVPVGFGKDREGKSGTEKIRALAKRGCYGGTSPSEVPLSDAASRFSYLARENSSPQLEDMANAVRELAAGGLRTMQDLFDLLDAVDGSEAKINLYTIHGSKGLEADRVWIVNPGLIPSPHAAGVVENMQQEFNLAYVAMTRAKHTLNFIRLNGTWLGTGNAKAAVPTLWHQASRYVGGFDDAA